MYTNITANQLTDQLSAAPSWDGSKERGQPSGKFSWTNATDHHNLRLDRAAVRNHQKKIWAPTHLKSNSAMQTSSNYLRIGIDININLSAW